MASMVVEVCVQYKEYKAGIKACIRFVVISVESTLGELGLGLSRQKGCPVAFSHEGLIKCLIICKCYVFVLKAKLKIVKVSFDKPGKKSAGNESWLPRAGRIRVCGNASLNLETMSFSALNM